MKLRASNTCQRRIAVAILALLCGAISALSPAHAAPLDPAITLSTSEATVYAGDSIVIEIEAIGLDEPLDLTPLSRDAELLRQTGGTRIGVAGGQVVEVYSQRLEFIAPAEGQLFFGPLFGEATGNALRSNTLIVNVLPPIDIDWSPAEEDLTASFSLSHTTPVVGERIVADLVLRYRDGHAITGEHIDLPLFDDFDLLPVHERRRVTVDTDDGPMQEISWRWLLFARKSGTLSLGDVTWRGEIIRSRTRRSLFERLLPATTLDVQPADADAAWWLPAVDVTVSDEWSRDPRELTAGDELVRTITLQARDVLARQLPVIVPLESRSIASTPIGEERSQEQTGDHVVATATFAFRLRATSPVPVFLDTVRVRWWNTEERNADEAIIAARRINIGLPERADLLAELALDGRDLTDRLSLHLASLGNRHAPWWITLGVLLILLLWHVVSILLERRREPKDPLPPL